jgi:hypothetical protein
MKERIVSPVKKLLRFHEKKFGLPRDITWSRQSQIAGQLTKKRLYGAKFGP